jgi:hypothetical protein
MIQLPDAQELRLEETTWENACRAADERRVDDIDLLAAQTTLAQAGRWDGVYILSVMAGLETSVLIDADDRVFIDWGTAGQVTLQPPVGGRLPFKLWVHTHPRFASYWSSTDTNSLSLGARILEAAVVLGQPGPKHSKNRSMTDVEGTSTLGDHGPLSQWTDEEPVPWSEWYALNNIETEGLE